MTNLDSILKSRDITLPTKVCIVRGFSSSHVQMWELDHKEGWAPKNWCFQTVVLEETLENPLDSKEIKAVSPKGNQPWIFIGRTGAEAETPILWPPDAKSRLTGKDPDAGKDWGQEEKQETENEMVGWHHRLNRHESKWALGGSERWEEWHAAVHGVAKRQTWLSGWTSENRRTPKTKNNLKSSQRNSRLATKDARASDGLSPNTTAVTEERARGTALLWWEKASQPRLEHTMQLCLKNKAEIKHLYRATWEFATSLKRKFWMIYFRKNKNDLH